MRADYLAAGAAIVSALAWAQAPKPDASRFLTQPLIPGIYTADPSAHVFGGRIFIYPSHDIESTIPADDLGSQFDMRDYHVFSMDHVGGAVTDHGVALDIKNVPWAGRQMWRRRRGARRQYTRTSGKGQAGRLPVSARRSATNRRPVHAQPQPIEGSYSIDPAVFRRRRHYLYFGGIWGGQLQRGGIWNPNRPTCIRHRTSRRSARRSRARPRHGQLLRSLRKMSSSRMKTGKPVTAL